MARLTLLDHPTKPTYLEFRLWASAGRPGQVFQVGQTCAANASRILWWEIIQVMTGNLVFYHRHFLDVQKDNDFQAQAARFCQELQSEVGIHGQCPQSGFMIHRVKAEGGSSELRLPDHFAVEFWLPDIGFIRAGILERPHDFADEPITFTHTTYNQKGVQKFLEEMAAEMERALQDRWLDPRAFEPSGSRWRLAEQLNSLAYDFLAPTFEEDYFRRPHTREAFEEWLAQIPGGASVLDVGCGHGQPVIDRLLEAGLEVCGIDLSQAMLARARLAYPQARFIHGTLQDLPAAEEFSAACSFSALLYLDPIDLSFALLRLYQALRAGGLLFVYSYFDHAEWVGEPVDSGMGAPMWAWDYDLAAAQAALNAHGFFEVTHSYHFAPPGQRAGPFALVARRLP